MKRVVQFSLLAAIFMIAVLAGSTVINTPAVSAAEDAVWSDVAEAAISRVGERRIVPTAYRTVRLDVPALRQQLANAPMELTDGAATIIELPQPDGTMGRFKVERYSMMQPGLAAQFPYWLTLHGQGVDDPTAVVRISITEGTFHGMVLGGVKGTYYIDPFQTADSSNYISYFKTAAVNANAHVHQEEVIIDDEAQMWLDSLEDDMSDRPPTDGILRTYRLANAATGEYCQFHGGTTASCQASIVTVINRVNGVYEREVNLRMILVANNTDVVYLNGATDPYTNNNGVAMLAENQANLDTVIGTANYDIGHVFSTGGGGVATLVSPCKPATKARGVTGLPAPTGDPFYIDYVAHEMGHQWGSNHTFNGTASNCGGNRSGPNAYEPGSGISIMAYAGICGAENIAEHSIDTFVSRSYDVIRAYIQNPTGGDMCAEYIDTGNDAPVVDAGSDYTIPAITPFELTGSATDSTPNSLTYDWQQYDQGTQTNAATTNQDLGNNPILRPWLPQTSTTRIFPDLTYILNNNNIPPNPTGCPDIPGQPAPSQNCSPGQTLPTKAHNTDSTDNRLTFRLVVRDNQPNAGGVDYDTMEITVITPTVGFRVTTADAPGTTWQGNSNQTITWQVGGTDAAPISCSAVNIYLSTDGGETFPTLIGSGVANDGSESIFIPNVTTTEGRLKIKCADNIFFDINNADISITAIPTAVTLGDLNAGSLDGVLPYAFALAGLFVVGAVALMRRRVQ